MIIIDAKGLIVGRFATYAAKHALLGEEVAVVNCEHAYITGTKKRIVDEYFRKRRMGTWATGPFYHRQPDRIVRRIIRGMLPYKQEKGRSAYKRIMCYLGVPHEFKNQKLQTIEDANINNVPNLRYIILQELSQLLGAKRTTGETL